MAYDRKGRGSALTQAGGVLPNQSFSNAVSQRARSNRANDPAPFEWAKEQILRSFSSNRPTAGAAPADPLAGMAPGSLAAFTTGMDPASMGVDTDPFMEQVELETPVDEEAQATTQDYDPLATARGTVADLEQQAAGYTEEIEASDSLLASGKLTPESEVLLMERRNWIASELTEVERQLRDTTTQLQVQDLLFNFELESQGIDFDIDPLEVALTKEGGVGQQTLQAIKDITGNSALTPEEQGQALDAVVGRAKFSDELVRTMHDLVNNQQTLEELEGRSDVELLGNDAKFFDPPFKNVVEPDDQLRWEANFTDVMNQQLPDVELDQAQSEMLASATEALTVLGPDHLNTKNIIMSLAQSLEIPYNQLRAALMDARDFADTDQLALDQALTSKNIQPGSRAMTYALMQAGRNAETPMPEEFMMLLANNTDIHMIIDVMSQGKSGRHSKNGTTAGLGGLTEEMYEYLMFEPWTPERGALWELEALIKYVFGAFGGDPMAAVDYYRKTGDWGGVYSAPPEAGVLFDTNDVEVEE